MTKPPAFLLYAADFYMDTNTWTIDEIGVYTRLLMSEWVNGPLPNEESRLARAAGCTLHRFKNSWGQVKIKFKENEQGNLFNCRLEEVRLAQKEYQEKQSLKGQKSAEKRWGKEVTTVKQQLQPGHKPEGNSSSSSSNIESINTLSSTENPLTCPHLEIISLYNSILCPPLMPVRPKLWKGKRATYLQARWREDKERQDIEWWKGLFEYIRDSCPFLVGKINDFKADMGWIITDGNMVKILEGKYQKGGNNGTRYAQPQPGSGNREHAGCSPGGCDSQGQGQEGDPRGMADTT